MSATAERKRPRLTDEERAERRQRDRERLERATAELQTSEGWQRWLTTRAKFHRYSFSNTLLIAQQAYVAGFEPTHVAGFKRWLELDRCVRKGEKALKIFAPMSVKEKDARGEETGEKRMLFRLVSVFDVSQTDPLPGKDPAPIAPPSAAIEGDSHAHLFEPLVKYASSLGYAVTCESLGPGYKGYCDSHAKRIVIGLRPENERVAVLIHEIAHALGVGYQEYGRDVAEVVVEAVAFIVTAGVGLDTGGSSVPYIAGWGEEAATAVIGNAAQKIDELASAIEKGAGLK